MSDAGHRETEKLLREIEKRVNAEYRQASKEVSEKLADYLRRFKIKDEIKRKQLADGIISQKEYDQWRVGQIMVGKRWHELQETLAQDMHNANTIARSTVQGYMPDVYAINHNYATFDVERQSLVNTSYTLYDRQTVEKLMRNDTELLQPPGARMKARIAAGKDVAWQKGQIQSVTLQGILQGESIPNLTKRIAQHLGDTNHASTVRYARTAVTSAQNAGRSDAYKRAENMGIKMKQMWIATLDNRTRHEHRVLNGQIRAVGEPFEVEGEEIMYPGDPSAAAHLVWNCRCTTRAVVDGLTPMARQHRDPSAIEGKTYEEWKNERRSTSKPITAQEDIGEAMKWKVINEDYRRTGGKSLDNDREKDIIVKKAVEQLKTGQHVSDDVILALDEEKKVSIAQQLTEASKETATEYVETAEAWSGNYFAEIRRYQRGNLHDADLLPMVSYDERLLENFINKSPVWKGGNTYRAIGASDDAITAMRQKAAHGARIDMFGTSSWTSSESIATDHRIDGKRVIFVSPTQKQGTSIMAYSETPYEYEVIVSKAASYAITDIIEKDGITYVYLEE